MAEDGSGKNGVYTQALLGALATPGLKPEEVFKQVRTRDAAIINGVSFTGT